LLSIPKVGFTIIDAIFDNLYRYSLLKIDIVLRINFLIIDIIDIRNLIAKNVLIVDRRITMTAI